MHSKICFISSSGGHFEELEKIFILANKYNSFLITEKTTKEISEFNKIYFFKQINRHEKMFIFHILYVFLRQFFIFLKQRPDYVISTGALISYPFIKIAKLFKKKIIYIESYARCENLSLTGKKVYPLADLFFVQHEELVKKYPKAIFKGNLFEGEI